MPFGLSAPLKIQSRACILRLPQTMTCSEDVDDERQWNLEQGKRFCGPK